METKELIQIDQIEAQFLPELQGFREKLESLVEENPFLEIEDNKTYEEAKKRRTALVTGRTSIQNQDKLIASKIKDFRSKVSDASKELILITQPHEEKQQNEVRRYERIRAEEIIRKQKIEAERKENIKNNIEAIYNVWKVAISNLKFSETPSFSMDDSLAEIDTDKFEEYEFDFAEKSQLLKKLLTEKMESLTITEKQRLEDERLKAERQKLEEEKLIAREKYEKEETDRKKKQRLEDEKRAESQAKIDAENKKFADILAKKETEIANEKARLAKIEEVRLAKTEADKQAKIEKENKIKEAKRVKALQPDKDKLKSIIGAINISSEIPQIKDESAKEFLSTIQSKITQLKSYLLTELETIN